jgi:tetratricopeptide (TPR) repeat protein
MMFDMRRLRGVKVSFVVAVLLGVFALPTLAADLHERAKNLYDVGDYHAALSLYERILRDDPDDGLAWDVSAWCLRYLGDARSSEENYKKALLLLKGPDAIWSLIGLGELYIDGGRYDDALVNLREAKGLAAGDGEAIERIANDIGIAEKALSEARVSVSDDVTPEDAAVEKNKMEDADERRAQALLPETKTPPEPAAGNESKSAGTSGDATGKDAPAAPPKPKQKPTPAPAVPRPPRNDTIYGVKLGSPITEALESLKKQGCQVGEEPFDMNGKEFYAVTGLKAELPDAITGGSTRSRFYIVSFGGSVFSVNVELDYGREPTFDRLKDAARGEIGKISGLDDSRGLIQVSNIFSYEMNQAVSGTYGVSMFVIARGNGTSRVEIQHIDLYGLSDYLSGKNAE